MSNVSLRSPSPALRRPCAYPAPVFNVSSAIVSENSIAFSWSAGSQLSQSFLVYGQRLSNNRRDTITGNVTLLQNSTSTAYQANDLLAGTTYLFGVAAVAPDGNTASVATYSFQTRATSGQQVLPGDGAGPRRRRALRAQV